MNKSPLPDATLEGFSSGKAVPLDSLLSVSAYVSRLQQVLEQLPQELWIQGEISNFTAAASGHWYFNLKDAQAQLRCVMFRSRNQRLDWQPRNGMGVELKGPANFYPPAGTFQITVESLRQAGLGRLYEAFLRLKARLEQEGLFDPARKRGLPSHPKTIGLITSPAAAALRDVLTTLKRRAPGCGVILYPAPVQGEGAAAQLAQALDTAASRAECDVLILCRGGGSIEDLWSFNEEILARAMARCPIPIISGVGHETDFTIADFVADQRAPTPTAAAELVSPDRAALLQHWRQIQSRLQRGFQRLLQRDMLRLDQHLPRLSTLVQWRLRQQQLTLQGLQQRLKHPGENLHQQRLGLEQKRRRLQQSWHHRLTREGLVLNRLTSGLSHLNPHAVLARGFSIVRTADGQIVRTSNTVDPAQSVSITLAQGELEATIQRRLS